MKDIFAIHILEAAFWYAVGMVLAFIAGRYVRGNAKDRTRDDSKGAKMGDRTHEFLRQEIETVRGSLKREGELSAELAKELIHYRAMLAKVVLAAGGTIAIEDRLMKDHPPGIESFHDEENRKTIIRVKGGKAGNTKKGAGMNVVEIVKQWLVANGYDGLCREDCGCRLGDLFACEGCGGMYNTSECKPGYAGKGEYDGQIIDGIWETKKAGGV